MPTPPHEDEVLVRRVARQSRLDRGFRGATFAIAALVAATMGAILVSLGVGSVPAWRRLGLGFLTSREWNPVTEFFGAAPAIYGTLVTSAIALAVALPLAFGIALFLSELAPQWLRRPLGTAIELLAAIPSIIYGMWGLFVLAPLLSEHVEPWIDARLGRLPLAGPLFQGPPLGIGLLPAGLILAVMILPFIAAVMRDVFLTVPPTLEESAYALGATTWEVVSRVVLPSTRVGVAGGVMLGLGRALGETMAVTFVIGNAHDISPSLLMPGTTIASTLANEFTEAVGPVYTSSLVALGLVLFCITTAVLALSRLLLLRLARSEGRTG